MGKEFYLEFVKWMEDGNAVKIDIDTYIEQTTQYTKTFSLYELKKFFMKNYIIDTLPN